MKMPVGKMSEVVAEFIDKVIFPTVNASSGLGGFAVGFVGGLAVRQTPQMVEQYLPLGKALGVVDENNCIDVNLAYEEASKAIKKAPLMIGNIRLNQDDLAVLRDIMNRYST